MIAVALIAAAFGVLLVRLGWGREDRGLRVGAGWALIAVGLVALMGRDGAWGLALGASVATLLAFVALAHAAITAPRPRRSTPPRDVATTVTLHSESWAGLGRRMLVFLLAVPASAVAAMLVALAGQTLARAAGWGEANAGVAGMFAFPVAWAVVTTLVMLKDRVMHMIRIVAVAAIPSAALFWGMA
ncbi:hypothetical protein [Sphingomonas sp. AX6]|uniref:hypothetical protein n=1 Tax=Sphingomonas sp. AX6 TaxID=2653171 RepID=UPI0012F3DD83|nr:hypothetical protein [Sphingomonas sp. AX6]VXC71833.1 conserved membrane hypothetical protein [Sphingomonas sp. AX6]